MRIAKKTQKLLVVKQDPSIILLILGGYLLFGGLYIIYKTLTCVSEAIVIGLLICGFFVCAGSFFISLGYGHSTIEMNKETVKGIYIRKGLFSSERVKFDLSGINSVYASENPWDFGNDWPYSSIVMSVKNREFELYSPHVWSLKPNRQIADKISDFLNISQSDPK
ncbi:MAG: hypothetical protein ACXQS5_01055 [Candidatus Methanospirareceae archaeon]